MLTINEHNYEKPYVLLGAGGHASVILESLKSLKKDICGIVAPHELKIKNYSEITYLGNDEYLIKNFNPKEVLLVNCLGSTNVNTNIYRSEVYTYFKKKNFNFATVVHPASVIASSVKLEEGVQIMAGVVIQPNTIIRSNTIINTNSSVDHDGSIGSHVHIAPGVTICGSARIQDHTFIGVGSNIIHNIFIDKNTFVRAGSNVLKNILNTSQCDKEVFE